MDLVDRASKRGSEMSGWKKMAIVRAETLNFGTADI
jgi:hypothetical protein